MRDFLWGVATSAGQIEGGFDADGRGLSIWDVFSRIPGTIADKSNGDVACDSYRQWKKDVALLKELGVNSYRFSVSWSRVFPEGKGKINQKGLDYYRRLNDTLNENGILPNVTLYHWDLPFELERLGGWLNRDIANWFAEYASAVFGALDAKMFSTLNEPIATYVGYALKAFAPGFGLERYGRQANHNILLAHGKAVQAFRASSRRAKIGIVVDIWNRVPADPENEDDVLYAAEQNNLAHGSYLSPVFQKKYNPFVEEHLKRENIVLQRSADDLDVISQPLDFYGLNCYNRIVVSKRDVDIQKIIKQNGGNFLENGSEFYPDAIYDALKVAKEDFGINLPVYITENGVGFAEEREENGMINDAERIRYLKGSFASLRRALSEGIDVRGYYLWSLMDNFEWTAGYSMKYGICTRDRQMKKSALFYKKYIEEFSKNE